MPARMGSGSDGQASTTIRIGKGVPSAGVFEDFGVSPEPQARILPATGYAFRHDRLRAHTRG